MPPWPTHASLVSAQPGGVKRSTQTVDDRKQTATNLLQNQPHYSFYSLVALALQSSNTLTNQITELPAAVDAWTELRVLSVSDNALAMLPPQVPSSMKPPGELILKGGGG